MPKDTVSSLRIARAWWLSARVRSRGDRAPDASPVGKGERDGLRLNEVLDPMRHNLLLFGGIEPSPEAHVDIRQIAEMIDDGFRLLIETHIVLTDGTLTGLRPEHNL